MKAAMIRWGDVVDGYRAQSSDESVADFVSRNPGLIQVQERPTDPGDEVAFSGGRVKIRASGYYGPFDMHTVSPMRRGDKTMAHAEGALMADFRSFIGSMVSRHGESLEQLQDMVAAARSMHDAGVKPFQDSAGGDGHYVALVNDRAPVQADEKSRFLGVHRAQGQCPDIELWRISGAPNLVLAPGAFGIGGSFASVYQAGKGWSGEALYHWYACLAIGVVYPNAGRSFRSWGWDAKGAVR